MESESESPITLSFMAERTRIPAPGFAGGAEGGVGDVRINGRAINHRAQHLITRGDVVRLSTPGGGGGGPPAERDPRRLGQDRALGYVEPDKEL